MSQKKSEFFAVTETYFERIKHYNKGGEGTRKNTIWMRLHFDLLDDDEFCLLEDHMKFHVVGLMMLAMKLNNKIPANQRFLQLKLAATTEISLDVLVKTKFFAWVKAKRIKSLIASKSIANSKQSASTETHTYASQEEDVDNSNELSTPTDVKINEDEYLQCVCKLVNAKKVCSDKLLFQQKEKGFLSVVCLQSLRVVITKLRHDRQLDSINSIDAYARSCLRDGRANPRVIEILRQTNTADLRQMIENIDQISKDVESELTEIKKNVAPVQRDWSNPETAKKIREKVTVRSRAAEGDF